jgi:hypothetical protein
MSRESTGKTNDLFMRGSLLKDVRQGVFKHGYNNGRMI